MKAAFLCISHPHAEGRLKAVSDNSHTELAGVFDPNAELAGATAAKWNTRQFSSAEELLLQDDIDLVVIEGRNSENSRFAIDAASAGKNILMEKPGAENAARIIEVAHSVERAGAFCRVGYHLRYSPSVQEGLAVAKSGVLGKLTTARFHAAVMQPWLTNEWFCDEDDMGGMVFLDYCHMLDLLILFLGEPTRSAAMIKKLDQVAAHPFEDSAAFIFEFGDVLAAGDCCGWEANDWIETWDIESYGTKGTLKLGIHPPWTALYTPAKGWQKNSDKEYDGEENYARELADIVECLTTGARGTGCDIREAQKIIQLISDLYCSAAGN